MIIGLKNSQENQVLMEIASDDKSDGVIYPIAIKSVLEASQMLTEYPFFSTIWKCQIRSIITES